TTNMDRDNQLKVRFYADVYFSRENLNALFFYTLKNLTRERFEDVTIYNLYDFDVGGLSLYDTDYAIFDKNLQAIMQHDDKGNYIGFSSLEGYPVSHYVAGNPYELEIDEGNRSLSDEILEGPKDLFIGLEWNLGVLEPDENVTIPIIMATGESKEEFTKNLAIGIEKSKKTMKSLRRLIKMPERNIVPNSGVKKKMKETEKERRLKEC
ncbi:MAG: hypothetical protein ACFFCS_21880, partial [Candidatus Hodarchaeota archaeon]